MINFTLRQIGYFIAAAEQGSTAAAARSLNVSQPSISMAVTHLEQVFGQPLFVRRPAQGLVLTPFGQRKLAEARHLAAQAAVFAARPDAADGDLEGHVSVGCFSSLAPAHIPGILRHFRETHPRVHVRLREGNLEELQRWLIAGELEIGLLYETNLDGALTTETVAEIAPYALLPADDPMAAAPSMTLQQLSERPIILFDLPGSRDFLLAPFSARGVKPNIRFVGRSLEMVRGMVANGHGASIMYTRPASLQSYDGRRVACVPLEDGLPMQRIVLARSGEFRPTPAVAALVECTRGYFAAGVP